MNTDNYDKAIERLVSYRRMAVLVKRGTPKYTTYIDKLDAGSSILAIACDKSFEEVYNDVCKSYDSKYRH